MIPLRIREYLDSRGAPYRTLPHPAALTAQELAAAVHRTGRRVAKTVLVEAEAQRYLAVLPACDTLDEELLADVLQARSVRLLREREFADLFPDSELGAEPPLGRLYDLQVVLDDSLADRNEDIVFRAGSHSEAVQMRYVDYERIERPIVAAIARRPGSGRRPQPGTDLHA